MTTRYWCIRCSQTVEEEHKGSRVKSAVGICRTCTRRILDLYFDRYTGESILRRIVDTGNNMNTPRIAHAKRTRRILKGLPRTIFYDLVWDYLERIEQRLEKIQRDTRRIARRSK